MFRFAARTMFLTSTIANRHRNSPREAKGGRQKESDHFFSFLVTFWSLYLRLLSLFFLSLFCQTPFARNPFAARHRNSPATSNRKTFRAHATRGQSRKSLPHSRQEGGLKSRPGILVASLVGPGLHRIGPKAKEKQTTIRHFLPRTSH